MMADITPVAALPGWQRLEAKGRTSYISPRGEYVRSKKELSKYLGDKVDLSLFDFATGKINASIFAHQQQKLQPSLTLDRLQNHSGRATVSSTKVQSDHRQAVIKHDPTLIPPLKRHSFSVIVSRKKLKVSHTDKSESPVFNAQEAKEYYRKHGLAHMAALVDPKWDNQPKPHQALWHMRLRGKRLASASELESDNCDEVTLNFLPNMLLPSVATDPVEIVATLANALHRNCEAVRGQNKAELEQKAPIESVEGPEQRRDLTAFINPYQPLFASTLVSEEDIRKQELVVDKLRKELKECIAEINQLIVQRRT